jgi:hypothetical protein
VFFWGAALGLLLGDRGDKQLGHILNLSVGFIAHLLNIVRHISGF